MAMDTGSDVGDLARDTPVLLIGFNRPALMRGQVEHLRYVAPRRVYVACDGPRPGRDDDLATTAATREAVDLIDWDCEVRTRFRDSNAGCAVAVSEALTWFFDHEAAGIILEDDVRVSPDFHRFAGELLVRYADDERVRSIAGLSIDDPGVRRSWPASYRFTSLPLLWGWATWRRAWDSCDPALDGWESWIDLDETGRRLGWPRLLTVLLRKRANDVVRGRVDTWDTAFLLRCLAAGAVHAVPMAALATNVGVDDHPTNPGFEPASLRPLEALSADVEHPGRVVVDQEVDATALARHFEATPLGFCRKAVRKARHRLR